MLEKIMVVLGKMQYIVMSLLNGVTPAKIIEWLVLITILILLVILLQIQVRSSVAKKRYTVDRNKREFMKDITKLLIRYRLPMRILTLVSNHLGMFNRYSHEKNLENATRFLFFTFGFTLIIMAVFLPLSRVLWYITLCYFIMGLMFVGISLYVFSSIARTRITNKLPEIYKIINSRYIVSGDIRKALENSMGDFDRAVRKEMEKISNVLKKNNKQEMEDLFQNIETTYKNEYLTLLLGLIRQAQYNGGNQAIRKQFEDTTEEILDDIENQKDLSLTSRTYMVIGVSLPFAVRGFEIFNYHALGDAAKEFYSSPLGIELKLLFFFAFMAYYGILLFMERIA